MAFPTIPTTGAGRIVGTVQANATATRTFPDLSTLTKNAGDLLIAIVVAYQTGTGTNAAFSGWTGGFTEFHDSATTTTMAIGCAYKWSTGSETGTFAVTQAATVTGYAAMIVMSIPGAHDTSPPEAGGRNSGTSTAANATALTPSWGAADTLWIAVGGNGEDATTGAWTGCGAAPTNYTSLYDQLGADVLNSVDGAVAFRQLNAASEDQGAFGHDTSNARSAAIAIAVRPASAVSQETGLGAAGAAAAGVQAVYATIKTEAGLGAASTTAAGVQAVQLHVETAETGLAAAAGAGSGTQTVQGSVTESVVSLDRVGLTVTYAPTAPTGVKIKAGKAAAAAVGAGTSALVLHTETAKTGIAAAQTAAAGTETVTPAATYSKAGTAVAAGVGAGPETVTSPGAITKAGLAAAAGAPGGTKLVESPGQIVKVGAGAATAVGAGSQTVTPAAVVTKAGAGAATGVGAGAKTVTPATVSTKAGTGAGTAVAAGVKSLVVAGQQIKTGVVVGTAVAAGPKALALAKAGTGALGAAASGPKVRERAGKAGVGAAAGVGLGPKVRERAGKAGLAAAAAAALGGKVRALLRTGVAALAPVGQGPRGRDSARLGWAVLEATAGGRTAPLPSSLTQGVAIPGYATTAQALGGEPVAGTALGGDGVSTEHYVTSGG